MTYRLSFLGKWLLAAVVLMTSMQMAIARGTPAPAGAMVICAGQGVVTVYVDENGEPVATPYICPDCALTLFQAIAPDVPAADRSATWVRIAFGISDIDGVSSPVAEPHARGPPCVV
ncbi:hypothetical protein [Pseudoprimorskyibacter insulae]|uniref:DUF2946 domain-containing protein n=1 Tax=Pseudoprimorskyibacter insulae TaxID=1695997 RepID=A0A2R8AVM6_9RHOB|nr:hypothetical protein [Pseudoprimorskyibacter insulae]SPF79964.1 hypothetical protein PRI8871_01766 [Pseudoprimorskyibacter insulae]